MVISELFPRDSVVPKAIRNEAFGEILPQPKIEEVSADQDSSHSPSDPQPTSHRVSVTVIDPHHRNPSEEQQVEKFIRVKGSKETAIGRAKKFYKDSGYTVVDARYVSPIFD